VPKRHDPIHVIPATVARALSDSRVWFVIGGQALRCFCPYRPSNDIDLGVAQVTGLLATKLHAILDRGTRRDFFDLYVLMQQERLALVDGFRAIRAVYAADVNEGLLLRAITYFDDADAEGALPGEGGGDWKQVRAFFSAAAGALVVPPPKALAIQQNVVDVRGRAGGAAGKPRRRVVPKRR